MKTRHWDITIPIIRLNIGWCVTLQCYVGMYSCWLHTSKTFRGLVWSLVTEWKHDKHLVG